MKVVATAPPQAITPSLPSAGSIPAELPRSGAMGLLPLACTRPRESAGPITNPSIRGPSETRRVLVGGNTPRALELCRQRPRAVRPPPRTSPTERDIPGRDCMHLAWSDGLSMMCRYLHVAMLLEH